MLVKFHIMVFWFMTLVLYVTWDTSVSERLTASIFMVDVGLCITPK
jgi:hypothetical protein